MFCPSCTAPNPDGSTACFECGKSLPESGAATPEPHRAPPPAKISARRGILPPPVYAIVSLAVGGAGQVMLGQTIKGVVMMTVSLTLALLTQGNAAFVLFPIAAIDAFLLARKLNDGLPIGPWECF
ncbi:MAG: zinc ribbon domain-containing protein [bacterium]